MPILRTFLIYSFIILFSFHYNFGQNIVNNGSFIIIKDGANIVIGGDFINKNDGISDGKVNLDGNIILKRNWINLANNEVSIFAGPGVVGSVIMNGTLNQYIGGTHSSLFENLIIKNSKKILNITDCKVNDTLFVDAVLDLNSHRIKILNSNPIGINYISKYIFSETNTNQGLGEVDWQIGSKLNSYTVPFGSGNTNGDDLAVKLTINSIGAPTNGSIRFATYPTDCQNNPFPPNVFQLDRDFEYIADRFWNIDPIYDAKPGINIQFKYLKQNINTSCNNGINENYLKAIRYNTLQNTWSDFAPTGNVNQAEQKLITDNIASKDFFAPWCLIAGDFFDWEIYFPNAFTPNTDGLNETFAPIGNNLDKLESTLYIYNRWGQLIFESSDINYGWNGYYQGKLVPNDVYVYMFIGTIKNTNKQFKRKGTVTVVR